MGKALAVRSARRIRLSVPDRNTVLTFVIARTQSTPCDFRIRAFQGFNELLDEAPLSGADFTSFEGNH